MPTNSREIEVISLITKNSENKTTKSDKNVLIGVTISQNQRAEKFFIRLDGQLKLFCSIENLNWIEESSTEGFAVIRYDNETFLIRYNDKRPEEKDFFSLLRTSITGEILQEPKRENISNFGSRNLSKSTDREIPRRNGAENFKIEDFLRSISEGDGERAQKLAAELARDQSDLRFRLVTETEKNLANSLSLKIQVESDSIENPEILLFHVPIGKTLLEIKREFERKSGIPIASQYFLAFGKYFIDDEYEFGSGRPVVAAPNPKRNKNEPKPRLSIENGDNLILYIARSKPFEK